MYVVDAALSVLIFDNKVKLMGLRLDLAAGRLKLIALCFDSVQLCSFSAQG